MVGSVVAAVLRLTEEALLAVLQLEVLVWELGTVDALAAAAIAGGEVTALDHEVLDDTVESRAFIAEALLAGCQGTEVLSSLVPVSQYEASVEER